ncbi:hypothetical protein LPJ74_004091 [Coemansia sp. RSA 1843]|nr:hypothetical protein LPJ74_004091 [Coemansia sp. RSA 1843]
MYGSTNDGPQHLWYTNNQQQQQQQTGRLATCPSLPTSTHETSNTTQTQQSPFLHDSGYEDLIRTMDKVLTQGPPIDMAAAAPSFKMMVDGIVSSGDSNPSSTSNKMSPTSRNVESHALDMEKLWKLYTRSESLLPHGTRIRNLLWRMDRKLKPPRQQQAEKTATTTATTAAATDGGRSGRQRQHMFGGPLMASPEALPFTSALTIPQTAAIPQLHQSSFLYSPSASSAMDMQRRSSSHTAVGNSFANIQQREQQPQQQQQQLQTSLLLDSAAPTLQAQQSHPPPQQQTLDLDFLDNMELARPLELWNNIPLGAPLELWLPNNPGNGIYPATADGQGFADGLPFAAGPTPAAPTVAEAAAVQPHYFINEGPHNTGDIVYDTLFIDARSSANGADSQPQQQQQHSQQHEKGKL